ncbi:MAG: hypothetical protein IJE15_00545 [Bacteroidaceae bacterium]|nr:hypothetical protein [Bacteroidaceae bacterium]
MKNSKQTTFSEDDMIAAAYCSLERMCNNMYAIIDKFISDIAKPEDKEDVAIAQCILQMAICKTRSLLQLSHGISIAPDRMDVVLFDPTSMFSILRSLYELVFTFRNIYIMTDTEDERHILLNIWKICGLNNRQKENILPKKTNQTYCEKQKKEAKDIEIMKQEISSILAALNIKKSAKKDIERTLNEIITKKTTSIKGYKFDKEVSCITAFRKISLTSSPQYIYKDPQLGFIYTIFSMHTHPSYLSILQFGQMYKDEQYKKQLKEVLTSACIFNAHLIQDFCNFIPECQKYYEQMEGTNIDEELRKQ